MIYKILVGNEHGGAATSSKEILHHFLEEDHFHAVFLCKGRFSALFQDYERVTILDCKEPPIITSKNLFRKLINFVFFSVWLVKCVAKLFLYLNTKRINVIHTTNNHALLVCLIVVKFLGNTKVITHWRCIGLASANNYKALLEKLDKIICISKAVKSSLPSNLRDKSIVIYNGIPVKQFMDMGITNAGKVRELLKLSKDDFLIGTIGSYTKIKGHQLIIESLKTCPKTVKAVLFGSCPNFVSENYLKKLKETVRNEKLEERIFFIDDTILKDPKFFLTDLDCFVGATWNDGRGEGFGLIYVEAMSQSLPVIAIDVGAAAEIVLDGETGILLKDNNPNELSNQIKLLISNRKQLQELGKNSYTRAEKLFDISKTMKKLSKVYEEYQPN